MRSYSFVRRDIVIRRTLLFTSDMQLQHDYNCKFPCRYFPRHILKEMMKQQNFKNSKNNYIFSSFARLILVYFLHKPDCSAVIWSKIYENNYFAILKIKLRSFQIRLNMMRSLVTNI